MKNIAIFASGNGSNFAAIAEAVKTGEIAANIALLVCDKPGARVIARAEELGIPVFAAAPASYADKAAYETDVLRRLEALDVQLIVLAGYMRLIGATLLEVYPGRIVNIHPSKLPEFPGKDAILRAYESGAAETGVTVHYVDAGMDTGPIIAQRVVEITPGDTLELLEEKMHFVEHGLYIETLKHLLES